MANNAGPDQTVPIGVFLICNFTVLQAILSQIIGK